MVILLCLVQGFSRLAGTPAGAPVQIRNRKIVQER
jgi:hypothetical protein